MYLRLYFLLPDEQQARAVVDSLRTAGISGNKMRAHKRTGNRHAGTGSKGWQRVDRAEQLESLAWRTDLVVFFLSLVALVISMWLSSLAFSIVFLAIMLVSFALGDLFAELVPRVHLREFEHALSHGEVLLMVDVKHDRVAEIENLVHSKHPAAIAGGSSWTLQSWGI